VELRTTISYLIKQRKSCESHQPQRYSTSQISILTHNSDASKPKSLHFSHGFHDRRSPIPLFWPVRVSDSPRCPNPRDQAPPSLCRLCEQERSGHRIRRQNIETILKTATGPLFNNAAQHYNHSFFWDCLTATKAGIPPSVSAFLDKSFGTVDKFKAEFVQKASTVFGSGWCYLAVNADKTVTINQYSNAANPIKDGGYPLHTVDTWEHAWYIDYENRKAEYFGKFWYAVNWAFVEKRLQGAPLA
jgi:Fe-Mn family superoxide dismutase